METTGDYIIRAIQIILLSGVVIGLFLALDHYLPAAQEIDNAFLKFLVRLVEGVSHFFQAIGRQIGRFFGALGRGLATIGRFLWGGVTAVRQLLKKLAQWLAPAFQAIGGVLIPALAWLGHILKKGGQGIFNISKQIFAPVGNGLGRGFKGLFNLLGSLVKSIGRGLLAFFRLLGRLFKGIGHGLLWLFKGLLSPFQWLARLIIKAFTGLGKGVKTGASYVGRPLREVVFPILGRGFKALGRLLKASFLLIRRFLTWLWHLLRIPLGWLGRQWVKIWQLIGPPLGKGLRFLWQGLKSIFTPILKGVGQFFKGVGRVGNRIGHHLQGPWQQTKKWFPVIIVFLISGVIFGTLITIRLNRVTVLFWTNDTKAEWVEEVTANFNAAGFHTESGKRIIIEVVGEGSPVEAQQAILNGEAEPIVWSPGNINWIEEVNQLALDRGEAPLVKDPNACPPLVYGATGFAMWRPMAEAMGWPDAPIGWDDMVTLAADPEGWSRYGHPEWGDFKFGHTHPAHSNTGFSMLVTLAYASLDRTEGLTPELVKSSVVYEAFRAVELNTYHYGTSTKDLMNQMADSPAYLHAVTASETAVIANNYYVPYKQWPYVFIFPAEGALWTENPYCILDREWVSEDEREAAEFYLTYLLAKEQQDMAIYNGLRPAIDIPLHYPISLDEAYGTDPRVTRETIPPLEPVSGATSAAIIDTFLATKKPSTIIILLDTSASMRGRKLREAVKGTNSFLALLSATDRVYAYEFNSVVTEIEPSGPVGDTGVLLAETFANIKATGKTSLYDAVCTAVSRSETLRAADKAAGEERLYGIVLLSDGEDTTSSRQEYEMFNCLPTDVESDGVKIFTIAYGNSAEEYLLEQISSMTNGQFFTSDPDNIEEVYLTISSEQ